MEKVNHPEHYNQDGKRECIEAMKEDYGYAVTFDFCITNAYKYLYRRGNKEDNSYEQDTSKAQWYFDYATGLLNDKKKFKKYIGADRLYMFVKKELEGGNDNEQCSYDW